MPAINPGAASRARDGVVGVIGLGLIGRGVAVSLARQGRRLAVFDVRRDASDGLSGVPALAESARAVAARADVVLLCVVDAQQVLAVLGGPEGLLTAARPGLVVVIVSTVSLSDLRLIAELAGRQHVAVVDAGVTGGTAAAAAGRLTAFVGGDENDVERVVPVLEDCCELVVRVGVSGAGMAAKIARNIVSYGCFRAAYEGGLVAERFGIDIQAFAAAIQQSDSQYGGPTHFLRKRGTVEPVGDPVLFEEATHLARLAAKDLAAAAQLARELDIPLPVSACVAQHFPAVVGLSAVLD